jgi:hypothetical protein
MNGLEERVFGRLPDATWIYTGDGGGTTLGPSGRTWKSGERGRQERDPASGC